MSVQLTFYNTLTRTKAPFAPIDPAHVRVYACGPTVYDYAHIGNGRAAIVFDLLFRLLRQVYGADHVVYARNVTDVDDKINARAARDFPGRPLNKAIAQVTASTLAQYREDVAALGCLPPTHEPRATDHMVEMRALIERLVLRGVAYVAEDHVLFSPAAMDARGLRYGALARRSLDEMLAGARVEVAPYKRDPMDFVLWKPSKPGEPSWESPAEIAVRGRPGWHIECSAMSMKTLLEPYGGGLACEDADKQTFDIHGGGIDLVFPHHENEIAQSCCALGGSRMANVWMHNGFLQVEGEKMSKSLGNFITMHDLLRTDTFGGRSWPGDVLRLAMLRTHYRDPIDWTAKELHRALQELSEWYQLIGGETFERGSIDDGVIDALCDDLNTHVAIGRLQELKKAGDRTRLRASLKFLGFTCDPAEITHYLKISSAAAVAGTAPVASHVTVTSAGRALGIASVQGSSGWLKLNSDGTYSADPSTQSRIDDLLARRKAARLDKNFAEADKLRDALANIGIAIKDNKDGTTTWEPMR